MANMGTALTLRRVYDPPGEAEGVRVLVDRLWPRGLTKERVAADLWAKDAAPSTPLRTWWGHDPARLGEFAQRYREELEASGASGNLAATLAGEPRVTLLYAARDPEVNHAVVLRDVLADLLVGRP